MNTIPGVKMLDKKWIMPEELPAELISQLSIELRIPTVITRLLVSRGLTSVDAIKKFFRPDLLNLLDPFTLDGMEAAINMIIKAITSNQKILIYGDYDVDGTCAASILKLFFDKLGATTEIYIPNRLEEGYGISKFGIDYAKDNGFELIISVDCGITAIDEAKYAKEMGLNLIISDHHQPKELIPEADIIINPLKPGCNYPFKQLSGAGIAFKIAQALAKKIGKTSDLYDYLDLVAIATAADIVPMTEENRILVHYGLQEIITKTRPGIKALLDKAGIKKEDISVVNIVFGIAPRINAVGRLGTAVPTIEILTSNDTQKVTELAETLNRENLLRRELDKKILEEAITVIEQNDYNNKFKSFVLHNPIWHQGVVGIVASRLVEKFYKPTVMLTTVDGIAKGSARSISGLNIFECLTECQDLLLHFGGHAAAAGLGLLEENVDKFRNRLDEIIRSKITDNDLIPKLKIDALLQLKDFTPKFFKLLNLFAPYGPQNMRPVFISEKIKLSRLRLSSNNHFFGMVKQEDCKFAFDVAGYDLADKISEDSDTVYDIVYIIDKIVKDDSYHPQLVLKDIHQII